MKKVGTHMGVDVYEDPNAPPNTMYFMNDYYINFGAPARHSKRLWLKRVIYVVWAIACLAILWVAWFHPDWLVLG